MNHVANSVWDGAKCAFVDWGRFNRLDGWGKFSLVACNVSLAGACAAGGIALPTAAIGYGVMLGVHGAHGLYCRYRSISERQAEVAEMTPSVPPVEEFPDTAAAIAASLDDQQPRHDSHPGAGTSGSAQEADDDGVREPMPEIVEQVVQEGAGLTNERAAIQRRLTAAVSKERWTDAALEALNMSLQFELPAEKVVYLLQAADFFLQAADTANAKMQCEELFNDYWAELTEAQKGQCVEYYAHCNPTEDDIQALRVDDTAKAVILACKNEHQRQARVARFGQQ